LLLHAVLRPRAAAAPTVQQSIDIYPPGPEQQTRRTLLQRANATNRRTDTVPLQRPCCAYYARSANSMNDSMNTHIHEQDVIAHALEN